MRKTVASSSGDGGEESICQAGTVLLLTWLTSFITAAEFVLNRVSPVKLVSHEHIYIHPQSELKAVLRYNLSKM